MYVRDSGESKKTNVMNFAGTFYFNYSVRASNRDYTWHVYHGNQVVFTMWQ